MSRQRKDATYSVGYGKPPAEHRFRKGQSGNPKGRPKKAKQAPEPKRFRDGSLERLLEQEAFRRLTLNENGQAVEMSAANAIARSIVLDGIKGNRLAKRYAMELLKEEERKAQKRALKNFEYFARRKLEGQRLLAQYKQQRREPPRLYPHPDDILLDEAKVEVHLLGPLTEDESTPFKQGALMRDWFYVCSALEDKCGEPLIWTIEGKDVSGALFLASWCEMALPPSFRRDEFSSVCFMMDLKTMTKSELRKRLKTMLREVGDLPETIEAQLARHKGAALGMGLFAEGFEKAAAAAEASRQNAENEASSSDNHNDAG